MLFLTTLIVLTSIFKLSVCSPPCRENLIYGEVAEGSLICLNKADEKYYEVTSQTISFLDNKYEHVFYFNVREPDEVFSLSISLRIKITGRLTLYIYDFKENSWTLLYVLEPKTSLFSGYIFFWCNITLKPPLSVKNYISNTGEVALMALNSEEFIRVYYDYFDVKAFKLIKIIFKAKGIDENVSQKLLTVDGIAYSYSDLPVTLEWVEGSTHTFSWKTLIYSSCPGKRYVLTSVKGLTTKTSGYLIVEKSGEIVAEYKTQFYVDTSTTFIEVRGGGWYNKGEVAVVEAPKIIYRGSKVRYVFQYWKGDIYSENNVISFTVTKPIKLTPVYIKQYYIQVYSSTTELSGTGWYSENQELVVIAPELKDYVFEGWYVNGTLYTKSRVLKVIVRGPIVIEAKYSKKIQLDYIIAAVSAIAGLIAGIIIGKSLKKPKEEETAVIEKEETVPYNSSH